MLKLVSFAVFGSLSVLSPSAKAALPHVITNCIGICKAIEDFKGGDIPFDITARSLRGHQKYSSSVFVEDETGKTYLHSGSLSSPTNLRPGNIIHAVGTICRWADGRPVTNYTKFDIIGPGVPPTASLRTVDEVLRSVADDAIIKISGRIKDVFHDDIDPRFIFFTVADSTGVLYAVIPDGEAEKNIFNLLDATVLITGVYLRNAPKNRPYLKRLLSLDSIDQVSVVNPPPQDPFDDPSIHPLSATYSISQTADERVLAHGHVVARWQGTFFLVRNGNGRLLTAETLEKSLPAPGDVVDVVGIPSANLYQLRLCRAIWRKAADQAPEHDLATPQPIDTTVRDLLTDKSGRRKIRVDMHGRNIRVVGDVRSIPAPLDFDRRLVLQCDDFIVPVETGDIAGAMQRLTPGCRVSVTGICIMDITGISAATTFPRIKGFFLVPRSDDDILVLQRPPWWTTARLLFIIALLALILAGSLVLNIALHRLVEKKSKALASESITLAESEIKTCERTRLAIELHDSIAQNLTGAAMEIRAANRSRETGDCLEAEHLDIALKTVDSCRGELRNCIWDLRNQALEESDMNKAIQLTLQPAIGDVRLAVRFNVARNIFSDHTLHTILCVIRELAINGVRHGHASAIRVAGTIENGHLLFSVRDNGCGYDVSSAPGMRKGHFGLQGIRERIRPYDGSMHVSSKASRGTFTSIDIKLPFDSMP